MTETTVVNRVKDRSKILRKTDNGYEYGWLCYNRRDRSKDYFNKVGEGTYEEATQWMSEVKYETQRRRVFKVYTGY